MVKQFLEFIKKSPSSYHAVKNVGDILKAEGFIHLSENKKWNIKKGEKYFVTRNDTSFIAFVIPKDIENTSFNIVATHTDSPTFKIKPGFQIELREEYVTLNTEVYGSPIYSTWFDRPLSVSGKVMVKDGSEIKGHLVNIDKDLLVIPNVSIHLDRDINSGKNYNPQIDLLPLISNTKKENTLISLIAEQLNVKCEDIISHDLSLYIRDRGNLLGANNEFIIAPQIDNLECTFASLMALINSNDSHKINILASFDNEEVGSKTKQGAASTFLKDVINRIGYDLKYSNEDILIALDNSFVVSADNAHALHPNHQEKFDPINRPIINKGIVIKHNANQSYATDLVSAAIFKSICDCASAKYQDTTNRSDQRGGSTLGNISTSQLSINTIDIGLPQLAMHSAMETAGVLDLESLINALKAFYASNLIKGEDNNFILK